MKGKLILLTLLLLGFGIFVFVRFYILDNQNAFGRVKIVSSPVASVFVDNLAVGKTPFEQKYKVGEYMLKLIPEGTATDTASWQGKIKIYKNALTYVNRELGSSDLTSAGEIFTTTKMEESPKTSNTGEIYVETEPQGAIIYLDNDEKGVSSLILSEVTKGDHELSVFLPRFLRRTQKINVDSGYRVNAVFKLAIDQSSPTVSPTDTKKNEKPEATASATTTGTKIIISDTPTGFLRVREEPSISASEAAQVKPGNSFDLLEEQNGWYKIEYEKGKEGWVYSQYAEKQ
ncbi:hypothetical protein A2954_05600 [Candidatus Roizmanbacteria bacterium RIFCSPLOWO2_01_FULL_37_12]|uniref:SH3b domain-containing protein n=1 Tax=Candidatus Roizmanbacteria bacterium RIFCSPLOWO2_01_FULL_37_12 TaxID=1802056 RepID=A0A1F7IBP2_9BACT|nr:MAG: hypothetical protein A2768_02340 [Candidatus Roizmanbacteria bacterium RIFCSPHIGHO2_01_FULL_37_16]OGK24934.1 MAG: hypothetical protein A3D76_02885 [Candidatus Roizmanbacteria bacterium RIFCSPHIGHO2_02_FULL_37_9b]OGK40783.1 MAG: hypothetical protein A2954_05600 [Candidatus Roizmanbacteria bacterium RIFCSPLOWO2_01_FULL_37_12]